MALDHTGAPPTDNEEHVSVQGVNAKRVAGFGITTAGALQAMPVPLVDDPFDYIGWSNPDVNGNYQTAQFRQGGAAGTLVRTLTFTYDGSNNITSIARS